MSKKVTLDTTQFERSHMTKPRGCGGWIFRNTATGTEIDFTGTITAARKTLPAGEYIVLP